MVRQNRGRKSSEMSTAEGTIEEAQRLMRSLVEFEKGRCGGDTEVALYRATTLWGIDEGAVRSLWKRRAVKFVKAHILDRLRHINAVLEERARQERDVLKRTAEILEERGHPAARIARVAAEMAGTEK